MRKTFSSLLALLLIFSLFSSAYAAEAEMDGESVTYTMIRKLEFIRLLRLKITRLVSQSFLNWSRSIRQGHLCGPLWAILPIPTQGTTNF